MFPHRERERQQRQIQEEQAIEEAVSEVKEARKARAKLRRRDSKQKDRLGADKEYLSRLDMEFKSGVKKPTPFGLFVGC